MRNKIWFDEVLQLTKTLMGVRSISPNVEDENQCVDAIRDFVLAKYENGKSPEVFSDFWVAEDGRKNFACLLKSRKAKSGKTIILMAHFDTVGVDDFARYGNVNIAFQPDVLAEEMKKYFESKDSLDDSETSAWQALQTGDWLFGRGSVDMKSGVAINIAVFRAFAKPDEDGNRLIDELDGNLLLLACSDEETESVGVLTAIPHLLKLKEQEKLDFVGVINTDYTAPRDEDENTRFIYSGTVGKLLPSFYILGVRTHVGEIFRGVDASQIAAELVRKINLNPEWMDRWSGELGNQNVTEVALPPVALQMRDLKSSYNVETAGDAFVYVNWLTLQMTPHKAMEMMKQAAEQALGQVVRRIEESYTAFEKLGGQSQRPSEWAGSVIGYDELCERASAYFDGKKLAEWLGDKVSEFASQAKDSRALSCLLVAELAKLAKLNGPVVVTFFSPPYYPSVLPQDNELAHAIQLSLNELPSDLSNSVQFRAFYPYISDLSYLRLDHQDGLESLNKFMPLFDLKTKNEDTIYPLDSNKLSEVKSLNCPVINIGPFGRDAHGLYERVYMPYSFETVPQIIFQTIRHTFNS
ncbi:MAG: M20/M25/M40 family metallo-hydrolase [Anaerolineales bacterium]|nr:M20/M25/M40 family metallo-hydrolase [Anaerolineales bacterium]